MEWNGFCGPAYNGQSIAASGDRLVNLWPQFLQNKNRWILVGSPGLLVKWDLGDGLPVRALYETNGRVFCVAGDGFYELYSDFTSFKHGTVSSASTMATIESNGTQVFITSNWSGYIFTLATDAFVAISDYDFPGASMGGFLDNYFLALEPNSRKLYVSALTDGTNWDALDYGAKESSPENVDSFIVDHNEVFLIGKRAEMWYNSGDADYPLTRRDAAIIEQGIAAPFARSRVDNSIFWLGADERGQGIAWRLQGYTPVRISNEAVEWQWLQYSTIADAISYAYQEGGHTFWVLTFPTANKTWVYDATLGSNAGWHERLYWDSASAAYWRHRAQCHCFAFGMHLVGDHENGKIYKQSLSIYDDNGAYIRCMRIPPYIEDENKNITVSRFEILMEPGVGLVTGQGSDPVVMARWSKDGGYTWGAERQLKIGQLGVYDKRAYMNLCGWGPRMVPEITITDPVKRIVIGATYEADGET